MISEIHYKIDDKNCKVILKKNIEQYLTDDLKKLGSDKKVLFLFDENINRKIIDDLSSPNFTADKAVRISE